MIHDSFFRIAASGFTWHNRARYQRPDRSFPFFLRFLGPRALRCTADDHNGDYVIPLATVHTTPWHTTINAGIVPLTDQRVLLVCQLRTDSPFSPSTAFLPRVICAATDFREKEEKRNVFLAGNEHARRGKALYSTRDLSMIKLCMCARVTRDNSLRVVER